LSTLLEMRTTVRTEMDLIDEPAVTDAEITDRINQGIKVVAAKVLGLYEDYFVKRGTPISLVAGQAEYDYPADIWGNKLRALIYRNGTKVHEIPRSGPQRMNSFIETERAEVLGSWSSENATYRPLAEKFRISPVPTANEASVLVPWYVSDAATLTLNADVCDLPEWAHVAVAYAKWQIAADKPGLGNVTELKAQFESLITLVEESLSNRVPDQWDLVDKDMTTYEEHT
jgi:hypothetical protein